MATVFAGFSGALLACAGILGFEDLSLEGRDAEGPDSGGPDAAQQADTGPCGYDKPFRTPVRVDLTPDGLKWGAWLTPEEDRIYFSSYPDGGIADLYVAARDGGHGPFGPAQALGCCDAGAHEINPTLTKKDGLMVFAASDREEKQYDLFAARWLDGSKAFGELRELGPLNSDAHEWAPFLAADGRTLWFASFRNNNWDIYVASMTADGGVGNPAPVGINDRNTQDDNPVLSADGHHLYFSSSRKGTKGDVAVWVAHRDNVSDDLNSWNSPILAGVPEIVVAPEVDSPIAERPLWISPDECRLYYTIHRGPKYRQTYMVERGP
ncbi:hypothetical protein LVJ94_33910 [Pendulispora rubella]|uniref:Uncharacterized protein n=1 Tax=Pendulispora rubella TaxID=2741070 RepID=A0ABZ2KUZ2_9BACT